MNRDPASILDIVLACRRLIRFLDGRTREDLDRDELLQFAVLHATALIGEAATRLSPEFRQDHPEVPWREIIGTRNRDETRGNAPEKTSALSSKTPDAVFIMMNPGSYRPLIEVRNHIHAEAIHELPISLVPTKLDTTQYQVMRVMHYCEWCQSEF
jgi:hypothetical protein